MDDAPKHTSALTDQISKVGHQMLEEAAKCKTPEELSAFLHNASWAGQLLNHAISEAVVACFGPLQNPAEGRIETAEQMLRRREDVPDKVKWSLETVLRLHSVLAQPTVTAAELLDPDFGRSTRTSES